MVLTKRNTFDRTALAKDLQIPDSWFPPFRVQPQRGEGAEYTHTKKIKAAEWWVTPEGLK